MFGIVVRVVSRWQAEDWERARSPGPVPAGDVLVGRLFPHLGFLMAGVLLKCRAHACGGRAREIYIESWFPRPSKRLPKLGYRLRTERRASREDLFGLKFPRLALR